MISDIWAPLTSWKRLQTSKFTLCEAPVAAGVIVVITSGSGNQASQRVVRIVGAFRVGQVLGVMIRCVRRDVADRRGDSLRVVDVGWSGEGRERLAGSGEKVYQWIDVLTECCC